MAEFERGFYAQVLVLRLGRGLECFGCEYHSRVIIISIRVFRSLVSAENCSEEGFRN